MPNRKRYICELGRYKLVKRERPSSTIYYAVWYDERAKETRKRSLRTGDAEEAERRFAKLYMTDEPMRQRAAEGVPLARVLERYYEHKGKMARSKDSIRVTIDRLTEFFGDLSVGDLTPDQQRCFVRKMKADGFAQGTIKRHIVGVLRPALTHAYDNGELDRIPPVLKGAEFGPDAERQRILTLDEMAALWDAITTDRLRMFFVLAINTLARPEAINQLTREQANLQNRLLHLNPDGRQQTRKRRPILPITDTLYPWLCGVDSGPLVSYKGRAMKSTNWHSKPFRQLREAVGLGSEVVAYTIRHTMATELRNRKVSAWELSGFLGHRTEGTTERYAKFTADHLSDAVKAIDTYCRELPVKTVPMVLDAVPFRAYGA